MLTRNNARQCRKYAPIPISTHPRNSRINIKGNRLRARYPSLVETMNKHWDVLSLSPIHRKTTAMVKTAAYWTTTTGDDALAAKVKEGHGGMYCRAVGEARQAGNAQDNGRVAVLLSAQELINGSINVIDAVSDILIAASPVISCSIPGTICRRSSMMISKLDCVFEWYLPITLFQTFAVQTRLLIPQVCLPPACVPRVRDKVYVIPNALVPEHFQPGTLKTSDIVTIVVLSRLAYRKSIDLLVVTAPRICNAFPNVRFVVVIDLPQMREKHNLQDRIELLGPIRPNAICSVLMRGAIFLDTSLTDPLVSPSSRRLTQGYPLASRPAPSAPCNAFSPSTSATSPTTPPTDPPSALKPLSPFPPHSSLISSGSRKYYRIRRRRHKYIHH
ncbi:hypothetical protein ARMGADRAFT_1078477 [Armillaria gallica]|uniref:Uncharacterized protein n=1 Tax=Armillaria gallica TaxID=47427 RepID=A0A2H3DH87_ARMGA|nr:hypothetical protein ARMGADRAFT_1078477 [Armillaria gallica]